MSLPAGFTRKDDKKWEEVTVPAENKGTGPPDTGKKTVKITSLDEIGQLAFRGIKQLNPIQSTVFETAYNTSENMLVCAPTGAGKTNVAMLTIVQCIKAHIEAEISALVRLMSPVSSLTVMPNGSSLFPKPAVISAARAFMGAT